MYKIGGRAHAWGITFESDVGRVVAKYTGKDTITLCSARTRRIKAALRRVPLLRAFPAFGKAGTVIFALLAALLLAEAFIPETVYFEIFIPDVKFYALLTGLAAAAVLAGVLAHGHVRRLLQYHGAEHMAINTYMKGFKLTADNIARADRANASCGSMFVLVFFIVGIPLMFVPYSDFFLPVAIGGAFELTLLARRVKWLRPLLLFGLWSQRRLFTRPPDATQIEVARRGLTTLVDLMDREMKGSDQQTG